MATQNPTTMEAGTDKVEAQRVELNRIIDTRFQAIQEHLRVELSSFKDEVMEALDPRRSAPMVDQTPGLSSIHGQDVQIPSEEEHVKIAGDSDGVKTAPKVEVEINQVPADTSDEDEIPESDFFDSFCQGNHYQYDTAPASVTICNICHLDIEAGQGWQCEVCPEYDVCIACYQKDGGVDHPHKLTNHPSIAAQNKKARLRLLRALQLRKVLELLVHASRCRTPKCLYPNCRKVKGLFRHGIQCKRGASGGCLLRKKMWYLLQLHARACQESVGCHVPRCRDLKEHLRRLQQQAELRRLMEMMRQNAA
ncbi:PREDICTED: histone acetyltransferase HAC1-like isoform X2 [Ipomoea nil]|uniref:histone acetyltransferase HAC1-like isoform X2 n=1 Tax=Ipomoea nil TaxID=35883 RepID=UPI0009019D37|nr:PREDICTED: histone acetyltransferase HAC1-like isoform X2 [Ipomoea nil]